MTRYPYSLSKVSGFLRKMNMSNMSILVIFLVYCALSCTFVDAGDECQDQMNKFKEAWQEATKEENAPECFQQYGLDRFMGTGEEAEDKRRYKELKEYMGSLSTEELKSIKGCFFEVGKMAAEQMGEEMSEECIEEMKQKGKKWAEENES
ncbi:hypothetical protein TNIN_33031 [Trichonephila inaurata madagascariensis]|uniref:Uncharacterized protein n=1 Tax=Trichonephila inaurata madagascariensis TaxID=2747483 RepID=A0A8X7CBM1_9ARAC|nr:hypothetical protein TNIN_33031 [Trichonephila inaurata madagascariensis]